MFLLLLSDKPSGPPIGLIVGILVAVLVVVIVVVVVIVKCRGKPQDKTGYRPAAQSI